MESALFQDNFNFSLFGVQHWVALVFFTLTGLLLIRWATRQAEKVQYSTGVVFSVFLSLVMIGWTGTKIYLN